MDLPRTCKMWLAAGDAPSEDPTLVVCACDCAGASCSGKGATHKQLPFRDEIRDSFLCESRSGIRFTTLSNY
jgi:hypothetical protein